jgi:hypothetical protein
MEQRLYLGALELAVGDGKKQEIGILHKSAKHLNSTVKKDQKAKVDMMSFKERSFVKLEKVSEQLIRLTVKLERRSQLVIVSKMLPREGRDKDNVFLAENGIRQQMREEYMEKLKHIPQQRRAELISQYGTSMWNEFSKRLEGRRTCRPSYR